MTAMEIRQLLTRWKFINGRKLRQRIARFEQLESRHLLAAAVWTNVLQALDVTGDRVAEVSPLDALLVINELNHPVYAGRSQPLPLEIDDSLKHPFIDVTCDGVVSPLDALLVINRLNARNEPLGSSPLSGRPTWEFNTSGGSASSQGKYVASACSPKLIEGDSYTTQLSARVTLPDSSSAVRVKFDVPSFDISSQQTIRDAVEIVLLDESGQPLALPFGINRDASYNWSESLEPAIGPGTQTSTSTSGLVATATFNLSGLAAGTKVQVVARLVNEDKDTNTSVRVQRVEIVDIQDAAPTGMAVPSALRQSFEPIDPQLLVDVSPSISPVYGRTSLSDDQGVLVTDLQLVNQGNSALSGRILVVIDNLSDPAIGVMHPDGFLAGGRPYFVLNGIGASGWLAAGESTAKREVRFSNPSHQQFTYTLTTLAELNSAPSGFTSTPLREIEAGKTYTAITHAEDPDGQALHYSLVAGPVGMTIDQASGQLLWVTSSADVGNHSVILRASDPFGLSVEQVFTIAVIENLPNRPPVFTSTPPTDATVAAPFEVQTFKTGNAPVAVTAGDFGTGISYVTANPGDATFGILGSNRVSQPISVGAPTPTSFKTSFVLPLTVDLGFSPRTYQNTERDFDAMRTADVDRDGTPDLIVTVSTGSSDQFNPGRVGHIGIRLGNGDGSFRQGWEATLPPLTNRGSSSYDLHYADFTGDGIEDILLTQYVGQSVVVYKGLAGGIFAATPTVSTYGGSSSYMQVADLNGDKKLDVVVFESKISGQFRVGLSVLLGNGDGTFGPETFYAGANDNSGPGYVMDADGKNGPDLVRINYTDQRIETRLNDGTGHFGETLFSGVYAFGNNGLDPMAKFYVQPITAYFGDFDGDGINDASVSSAANGLLFLKGTGTGTFGDGTAAGNRFNIAAYVNYGTNTFPATYHGDGVPYDFNGDGKLDVIYGDSQYGYLTLGTGRGDGTFALHSYNVQFADDIGIGARGNQPTYRLNVADYNRDGVLDVAIGSQLDGSRPGSLAIILGDQVGTLRAVSTVPFGERQFGSSVVGDFTGDGIPDIAAHDGQGIIVAVGHGDGTFDDYRHGLNGGEAEIHSLISADFDGDGNQDLAWQGFTGLGVIPSYYQAFGLGNGFFQLAASVFPPQPANPGRSGDRDR